MSTPYTPVGGTQAGEFTYDYDDAHGQGLVTFAGLMLMIAAVLNTLYGIAAIDKAKSCRRCGSPPTRSSR